MPGQVNTVELREASTAHRTPKRKQTHTRPRSLEYVDLDVPARLRVGHMMSLFGVSHSTLYKRKKAGLLPEPDGDDGRPYWLTTSIKPLLSGAQPPDWSMLPSLAQPRAQELS